MLIQDWLLHHLISINHWILIVDWLLDHWVLVADYGWWSFRFLSTSNHDVYPTCCRHFRRLWGHRLSHGWIAVASSNRIGPYRSSPCFPLQRGWPAVAKKHKSVKGEKRKHLLVSNVALGCCSGTKIIRNIFFMCAVSLYSVLDFVYWYFGKQKSLSRCHHLFIIAKVNSILYRQSYEGPYLGQLYAVRWPKW